MQKNLYIKNKSGQKLFATLANPTNKKTNPIIILTHGRTSTKRREIYIRLEEGLHARGISTFRFDFSGHGKSEGKIEDLTISLATNDVLSAIDYLNKKGYKKVALVGTSMGGLACIIVASRTNKIFALALRSPVSDYEATKLIPKNKAALNDWRKKGYRLTTGSDGKKHKMKYSFYLESKKLKAYSAAKKIKIPTLIAHGDFDKTVPVSQSKKTARLIKNCTLKIIKNADHTFSNPALRRESLNIIFKFLVAHSNIMSLYNNENWYFDTLSRNVSGAYVGPDVLFLIGI